MNMINPTIRKSADILGPDILQARNISKSFGD